MARTERYILGIESSCDESGVALYGTEQGLLAEALFSQVEIHALYGGVVPELASRDHVRRLPALVRKVLAEGGVERPDAIAATAGPGLIGALLVGVMFAKSLALAWRIPIYGVHHLEGHLLAPFLEHAPPEFPFLALLVSGGHSMLVEVTGFGRYRLLGESIDDAAGEAFDKTAKYMGLGYPGGPVLSALAVGGDRQAYALPRPLLDRPGLDFSFSGLKTAAIQLSEKLGLDFSQEQLRQDFAASFQEAVVDVLMEKTRRAMIETGLTRVVVAGGVGANARLRERFQELDGSVYYPSPKYCTDNGAMIALAGALKVARAVAPEPIVVKARWSLEELEAWGG